MPGTWLSGRSDRFSVMALRPGTRPNVVGTAFLDGESDAAHENDSPPGAGELGVFPNQFVSLFNMTYNNWELTEHPITAADVPTLEAVLYGLAGAGRPPAAIRMAIDGPRPLDRRPSPRTRSATAWASRTRSPSEPARS